MYFQNHTSLTIEVSHDSFGSETWNGDKKSARKCSFGEQQFFTLQLDLKDEMNFIWDSHPSLIATLLIVKHLIAVSHSFLGENKIRKSKVSTCHETWPVKIATKHANNILQATKIDIFHFADNVESILQGATYFMLSEIRLSGLYRNSHFFRIKLKSMRFTASRF